MRNRHLLKKGPTGFTAHLITLPILVVLAACNVVPTATPDGADADHERSTRSPGEDELTGMFFYMADAAIITLCADGRRLAVAMEGDYLALESAYLRDSRQPAQELLVSVEGTVETRPPMEGAPRPHLVVKRFIGTWPRETCGNTLADSPLRNTYWKLVRLEGAPVPVAEGQTEPHLILASDELRVSGSGGCNRVMGSFELDGDRIRFNQVASTMMACADGMDIEQRFLKSLESVERLRISGSHLDVLDAGGAVVARFEAVTLR